MRGQHQTGLQAALGLRREQVIHLAYAGHIRQLEVVLGMLELLAPADLAISHASAPRLIPDGIRVVERDQDALQAVGQFHRDGIQRHAAHLLEVRELSDLLAVQPDFPAQAPGRYGGLLPVVLDEADVMLERINTQRLQRIHWWFGPTGPQSSKSGLGCKWLKKYPSLRYSIITS